jgi:integrase
MDGITTLILTLGDIVLRLKDDPFLGPTRRRDLISAVLRVSKIVNIDPNATPASLPYMRPLIKKVWPAKHGLRPKTWRNLRSNFRSALQQVLPPLPRRIDPEWEKLRSRLPDQRMKAGLSRFIHYCEREDVTPALVCDAVLTRFLAKLETDTLVPSPRDCHRRTCQLWNEAAGKVPGWPQVRVSVPAPQNLRGTLPLSAYPERVQKEFELCISPPRGHRFTQQGYQKRLRPATVAQKKILIELAFHAVVEAGTDPATITTLDYLFEPHVFQTILQRYCENDEDETPRPTARNLAGTLIALAKQRLGSEPAALARIAELRRLRKCLGPQPEGLTAENRQLLREFADPGTRARLLSLPERLADSAARATPVRGAQTMAVAVAVAILLSAPMRISNLAGLHLERHLRRPGGPRSLLLIEIPPEEVKNSVRLSYELPRRVTSFVDRFVRDFRPLLANAGNPYLFPVRSHHKDPKAFSREIRQVIADWVGIDMSAHQFRHLAGLLMQRNSPGSIAALAQLLGHKRVDTAIRYYAELDTLSAGREFDAIVEAERAKARLPRRGSK